MLNEFEPTEEQKAEQAEARKKEARAIIDLARGDDELEAYSVVMDALKQRDEAKNGISSILCSLLGGLEKRIGPTDGIKREGV